MKQVCLARHIDDLQQSYEKKKRIPTDKQSKYSKLRKGYSTRSLTKVENLRDVNNKKADSRKKTRSFNLSAIDVAKDANIYSFEQEGSFKVSENTEGMDFMQSEEEGIILEQVADANGKEEGKKADLSDLINSYTTDRVQNLYAQYGRSDEYNATGLKNLRNTCYMNSVLQCLAHTEKVLDIMNDKSIKDIKGTLFSEVRFLLTAITSGEYRSLAPYDFKRKVEEQMKEYAGNRQHDAQEFMASLVKQIDTDINRKRKLTKIFEGKTQTKVTCKSCGKADQPKVEEFTNLHVVINGYEKPGVLASINDLQKPEEVEYKCLKCGVEECTRTTSFLDLPEVLVLQIKRFVKEEDSGWITKRYDEVEYPSLLHIEENAFELYACISHTGSLTGGHYVALCKQSITNKWFSYDDDKTGEKEIGMSDIEKSRKAYILFYKKRKQSETLDIEKNGPLDGPLEPHFDEPLLNGRESKNLQIEGEETRSKRCKQPSQKIEEQKSSIDSTQEMPKDQENVIPACRSPLKPVQEKCNKCLQKWSGFQIACDDCGEWFHGKCVGAKEGDFGETDVFRCTTCWEINDENNKEPNQQKEKSIAELKEKVDNLMKEIKKAAERSEKQEKENRKQGEKIQKQTEDLAKKKNELKTAKEEKEKVKKIGMERAKKLKEQETLIYKISREKADLLKDSEKMSSRIKQLEDEKKRSVLENEESKVKLVKEIENREIEIDILNRVNQELKRETRINHYSKTMILQNELPIITEEQSGGLKEKKKLTSTETQCYLEVSTQQNGEQVVDESGSVPTKSSRIEDIDIEQLQQGIAEYKKVVAEKVNTIDKKNKEIESLKVRVGEYRNRLENTLAESSAREREVHHLTDALGTLRRTNIQLVVELGKKTEEASAAKTIEKESKCEEEDDENDMDVRHNKDNGDVAGHNTHSCKVTEGGEDKKKKREISMTETVEEIGFVVNDSLNDNNNKKDRKKPQGAVTRNRANDRPGSGEESNDSCRKDGKKEKTVEVASKNVRKEIVCIFGINCKFWKSNDCRYHHPEKYEEYEDRELTEKDKSMAYKEGHKSKPKPCWHGKFCTKDDCTFEHNCINSDCKRKRCKYIHPEDSKVQKKDQARNQVEHEKQLMDSEQQHRNKPDKNNNKEKTPRKDILCRYYRNCREGGNCPYFHPKRENVAKNGEKEMQGVLHFLQKEMQNLKTMNINLRKEVKEIKKQTNRGRRDGESQERMH